MYRLKEIFHESGIMLKSLEKSKRLQRCYTRTSIFITCKKYSQLDLCKQFNMLHKNQCGLLINKVKLSKAPTGACVHIRSCHQSQAIDTFLEKAQLSALYSGHGETKTHSPIKLDLNIEERLADYEALVKNIQQRGLAIECQALLDTYRDFAVAHKKKERLETLRRENGQLMAEIVKQKKTKELDDLKARLVQEGKSLRQQLKGFLGEYNKLETSMYIQGLQLPADIHSSTPTSEKVIEVVGEQKTWKKVEQKSHMQLGLEDGTVILNGQEPGGYYLTGDLARCQMQIEQHGKLLSEEAGYMQAVCPDMVRKIVQEGCGKSIGDPNKVLMVHRHGCDIKQDLLEDPSNQMYLTGVSPQAFIAYVTTMAVTGKTLPLKMFSSGSQYSVPNAHASISLLNIPQTNVVELCGMSEAPDSAIEIYEELTQLLRQFYSQYDLHYRLVRVPVSGLEIMETAKTELQIWIPSKQDYITAGHVAMWGDYASRRLMIQSSRTNKPLHTVHCTLVRIPTLLAALLEIQQKTSLEL